MRLYARAGVLGRRPGQWHDLDGADPRVRDLLLGGLLTELDDRGRPAPDRLEQQCCGRQ